MHQFGFENSLNRNTYAVWIEICIKRSKRYSQNLNKETSKVWMDVIHIKISLNIFSKLCVCLDLYGYGSYRTNIGQTNN